MFDAKTIRAVVLADLLAFVSIAGIAWFLGFDLVPALIGGAIAGTLSAAIVLGAAARARHLGTDQLGRDELPTPPQPRHPGAPDGAGDDDLTDEDHRG